MKDKKNFRFEFVVFNISQENATFLWRMLTRWIEFLGFDVTGDVTDNDNLEIEDDLLVRVVRSWKEDNLEPDGFPK